MRRRVLDQWLQGHELKEWVRRSTAAALFRVSMQRPAIWPASRWRWHRCPTRSTCSSVSLRDTPSPSCSPSATTPVTRRSRRRTAQSVDWPPGLHSLAARREPLGARSQQDPPWLHVPARARLRLGADVARGLRRGLAVPPLVLSAVSQPVGWLPVLRGRDVVEKNFLPIAPEARPEWRGHLFDSLFVVAAGALHIWATAALRRPGRPTDRCGWRWRPPGWCRSWSGTGSWASSSTPITRTRLFPGSRAPTNGTTSRRRCSAPCTSALPKPWYWLDNNIMEHNAHHALPVIPLYNLQSAQRHMRAAFPDIHEIYMSPPVFCASQTPASCSTMTPAAGPTSRDGRPGRC